MEEIKSLLTDFELKSKQLRLEEGGVEVRNISENLIWKLCLTTLLAESVRIRLCSNEFKVNHESDLKNALERLPIHFYLPLIVSDEKDGFERMLPQVKVSSQKSSLYHTGLVEQIVRNQLEKTIQKHRLIANTSKNAIIDSKEECNMYVRLNHNKCQFSLDASGAFLYKRTNEKHVGTAPIRETIASCLIRAAQITSISKLQNDQNVIWDPFAGSGTFVLETIRNLHSGAIQQPFQKTFAFETWRNHKSTSYETYKKSLIRFQQQQQTQPHLANIKIIGSDISRKSISAATFNLNQTMQNLKQAGLSNIERFCSENVELLNGDFDDIFNSLEL